MKKTYLTYETNKLNCTWNTNQYSPVNQSAENTKQSYVGTAPRHKMSNERTNHKRIEHSRTYTKWTKSNRAKQLHPSSLILALYIPVANRKTKITKTWNEKTVIIGERHVKLWASIDAETINRKLEDWCCRGKRYPDPAPWDAGMTTKAREQIFAQSRPNKRRREKIAEIDAELMRRANRLGGRYQPKE